MVLLPANAVGGSWESASRVANRNGDGMNEILKLFLVMQYVLTENREG